MTQIKWIVEWHFEPGMDIFALSLAPVVVTKKEDNILNVSS